MKSCITEPPGQTNLNAVFMPDCCKNPTGGAVISILQVIYFFPVLRHVATNALSITDAEVALYQKITFRRLETDINRSLI